jgi:hypothetical protein
MSKGDQVTADLLDSNVTITITRNPDGYRVVALDLWARPVDDGRWTRDFPGTTHDVERAARDHATIVVGQLYAGGPIRWITYRADSRDQFIKVHEPALTSA